VAFLSVSKIVVWTIVPVCRYVHGTLNYMNYAQNATFS